jgi:hypothetical protein
MPTPSKLIRFPIAYDAFMIITIILAVILIFLFIFCSYKICKNWNQIIPRYRFLFGWSLYFIFIIFFLILTGIYQSYDSDGIKLTIMLIMCNFYVILLQILWRFSPSQDSISENRERLSAQSGAMSVELPFNEKKGLGLEYFSNDYDIEIKTKPKGLQTSQITVAINDEDNDGDKYVPHSFELNPQNGQAFALDNDPAFNYNDQPLQYPDQQNQANYDHFGQENVVFNNINHGDVSDLAYQQFDNEEEQRDHFDFAPDEKSQDLNNKEK